MLNTGQPEPRQPLKRIRLDEVKTFSGLLGQMKHTAFSGRQLGEALDVLVEMASDPGVFVVLTVSGAMTAAEQGLVLSELLHRKVVKCVVTTGAVITHELAEVLGGERLPCDPANCDDEELEKQGYNRILDTLESEASLDRVEQFVIEVLGRNASSWGIWSSAKFCSALGQTLSATGEVDNILRSAYENGVPVFIPAFTDCEIGLDTAIWAIAEGAKSGECGKGIECLDALRRGPLFNPFLDLLDYSRLVMRADSLGILTIGGGVPRNWAQQAGPFLLSLKNRVGGEFCPPRFRFGVRICPEPTHWGGLSGATYREGISWGKMCGCSKGGRFAEIQADATIVLPVLVKALIERLDEGTEIAPERAKR